MINRRAVSSAGQSTCMACMGSPVRLRHGPQNLIIRRGSSGVEHGTENAGCRGFDSHPRHSYPQPAL